MSDASAYHRNAMKCYRLANEAEDDDTRESWLAIGFRLLQQGQAMLMTPKLRPPVGEASRITRKRKRFIPPLPLVQNDGADSR